MNSSSLEQNVNLPLIESLIQAIRSLSPAEQALLEEKLWTSIPEPSTLELMKLAEQGGSFDFWHDEPDLYTLEDGVSIDE
ncbi:hypothetical protein [Leptolyngbya sp. NIES-2104]|uniref:hypothetical protein n=1 Tax=Leptolyngbya sp. NIES-2104 TaxID=1552121 RepID=UPI0006EC7D66|nr:hypothetical protein [Leptolyngbya sp. NIES-2104]GAP96152.1 hypothetical protein NIES2104_26870 [Leptolyngbya sp. NIES-2104]